MAYIYDLTDTWNAGATTFNGIKLNVTDSASAVASKLVTLQTNGTEHFSVTKAGVGYVSGNLGVGTSSPIGKLDLFQSSSAIAYVRTSNQTLKLTADDAGSRVDIANSAASDISFTTGVTERMRITSAGSVGIGTSSPSSKLTVSGGATATGVFDALTLRNSLDGGVGLYFDNAVSSNLASIEAIVASAGAGTDDGNLVFSTALNATNSERMRIDANGNLLINRSSTSGLGKLNVEGGADFTGGNVYLARDSGFVSSGSGSQVQAGKVGIMFNANTNQGLALQETAFGSGSSFILFANLSGTAIGSITQSGTSNVLYNTSSDARLKENVADSDDAASLIDAIQVRKFDWKADGIHQRYGFIAQELVEIVPEAVSVPKDPEDTMGVDYSKLVPMLVKEIQSLRARVAQLEGAA